MFITDKQELKKYETHCRVWQGISSMEVTKKGRIFATFYSGGIKEGIGNYCLLVKSDDGGEHFSEPIAVSCLEEHRCGDPCLWIDPLGRLWYTWCLAPDFAVYAVICDDPDAEELVWHAPFIIGKEVLMNKPTVLSTGEWLFPIAIWKAGKSWPGLDSEKEVLDRKAFVYRTVDNGETFERIGGAEVLWRAFDEHMILEHDDGKLAMYVRTDYGIGVSYSYDRGKTWTAGGDSGIPGPSSRFFIRRLKSGRVLMVNHHDFKGRNNLYALLSEDEGKTWKYKMLLDEREDISYPDGVEAEDGYIYITYDRERGDDKKSLEEAYSQAREILFAKFTEADIINGSIKDPGSKLKCIISKLGELKEPKENLFQGLERFTDEQLVDFLLDKSKTEILSLLFDQYKVNCVNMHMLDNNKLDAFVEELEQEGCDKKRIIQDMIFLIRSVAVFAKQDVPVVERVKEMVQENFMQDLSMKEMADKIGISQYYMCHLFKKITGLTIGEYKNILRLTKAKKLLVHSDDKIADIAQACGFGSESYFAKTFTASERVSPAQYRKSLKH